MNSSVGVPGIPSFPVAFICSQREYLVSETLFALFLSSFGKKKWLDTVEHIKAAQQPIAKRDFNNRARLRQSEALEHIADPFYLPIRNAGKEFWKTPVREQIGVQHPVHQSC